MIKKYVVLFVLTILLSSCVQKRGPLISEDDHVYITRQIKTMSRDAKKAKESGDPEAAKKQKNLIIFLN